MWCMRDSPVSAHDRWIVLSFLASTRVMQAAEAQLLDVSDLLSYRADEATLACGSAFVPGPAPQSALIQVTRSGVYVTNLVGAVGTDPMLGLPPPPTLGVTTAHRMPYQAAWLAPGAGPVVCGHVADDGSGTVVLVHSRSAVVTVGTVQLDADGVAMYECGGLYVNECCRPLATNANVVRPRRCDGAASLARPTCRWPPRRRWCIHLRSTLELAKPRGYCSSAPMRRRWKVFSSLPMEPRRFTCRVCLSVCSTAWRAPLRFILPMLTTAALSLFLLRCRQIRVGPAGGAGLRDSYRRWAANGGAARWPHPCFAPIVCRTNTNAGRHKCIRAPCGLVRLVHGTH